MSQQCRRSDTDVADHRGCLDHMLSITAVTVAGMAEIHYQCRDYDRRAADAEQTAQQARQKTYHTLSEYLVHCPLYYSLTDDAFGIIMIFEHFGHRLFLPASSTETLKF